MLLCRPRLVPSPRLVILTLVMLALVAGFATVTPALAADTTPPQAFYQFDPATGGVSVFGLDEPGGSGLVNPGPIAPTACTAPAGPRSCVYRVADLAGNNLTLTLRLTPSAPTLQVRVLSVQASGRSAVVPLANSTTYSPAVAAGDTLTQDAQVTTPPLGGTSSQAVHVRAVWSATSGQTAVTFIQPPDAPLTLPGLVLLRVVADASGRLRITLP